MCETRATWMPANRNSLSARSKLSLESPQGPDRLAPSASKSVAARGGLIVVIERRMGTYYSLRRDSGMPFIRPSHRLLPSSHHERTSQRIDMVYHASRRHSHSRVAVE
jgi:hypothetical protein